MKPTDPNLQTRSHVLPWPQPYHVWAASSVKWGASLVYHPTEPFGTDEWMSVWHSRRAAQRRGALAFTSFISHCTKLSDLPTRSALTT